MLHLIGVVGVEVGHDVAGVHRVDVEVVVVVVIVVDVVVDVEHEGEDARGEGCEVHCLGAADDGGAGGAGAGPRLVPLVDGGQVSPPPLLPLGCFGIVAMCVFRRMDFFRPLSHNSECKVSQVMINNDL